MGSEASRLLGSHPTPSPLLACAAQQGRLGGLDPTTASPQLSGKYPRQDLSLRRRTHQNPRLTGAVRATSLDRRHRRRPTGPQSAGRRCGASGCHRRGYFAAQRRQAAAEVPTNDPMQWLPIEATGFDYGAAAVEAGYTRCPNCGLGYRCAWDCPHPWQWREAEPEFGTFLDYRQSVVDGEEWISRQRDAAVAAVGGLLTNLPGYDWVRNRWPGLPLPL